uniref:GRIP domain-containing protein n=1 Tax=Kryptolebias marmoratus TaxID=37003 RepID=A0A3Q2ZSP8_KRYMA
MTTQKLDTLSKDDLIKYAKKQMAVMQKMKSRCSGLYCRISSFVQEDLTVLQSEHESVMEDQQKKIETLECSIEESRSKHQEEVAYFQKLLKQREERDRERECEREKERKTDCDSAEGVRRCLEAQLETIQAELKANQERNSQEIAELRENYQRELTKAQQDVENLKEDLAQKSQQHEEEMRALEEDWEIERERLLLLTEELTEQLALKGTAEVQLQDVQEEDEESTRGSGIAKMLALSECRQADTSNGDGEEAEISRLRAALDDLQSKNTMFQDELTLLSNVKGELEAELDRAKEEFQMEKEELEFKINELQMVVSPSAESVATLDSVPGEEKHSVVSSSDDQKGLNVEEDLKLKEELKAQCEGLARERDSAVAECHHMRGILQSVETELGEKTKNFVQQYNLLVRKTEGSPVESSAEEQTSLTCELKQSVEVLTRQNEEILSQLKTKENLIQDLGEQVNTLTEEKDKLQHLLKLKEDEMQNLSDVKTKDTEKLLEETAREAHLIREEKDTELENLKIKTENEVKHLKEEKEKVEGSLNEKLVIQEERCSTLDLTVKELSTEKSNLLQELEQALSKLSKAQEDSELLGSKLAELEAQMEQGASEKQHLEAKLKSLTEEAEQASASVQTLRENQAEVLKKSTDEVVELRTRVDELEKERGLLKSSLEEADAERRTEELQKDFQAHIEDLEKERDMLRRNLEEMVKDAEGLQKDLQDMKSANEKIIDENQKLQARVSVGKDKKEEEEMGRKMESVEKNIEELRRQLTEKDSLISQLTSEITALQVDELSHLAKIVIYCLFFQVQALREEVESLKAEREKTNSSMKDIIHGAEGYKVLSTYLVHPGYLPST